MLIFDQTSPRMKSKTLIFLFVISHLFSYSQNVEVNLDTVHFLSFTKNAFDAPRIQFNNVDRNTLIGYQAGISLQPNLDPFELIGEGNTFLGDQAGKYATIGFYNTYVGQLAGEKNIIGIRNTSLGRSAGKQNESGDDNTFIGSAAGQFIQSSSENISVGNYSGWKQDDGNGNVYLGYYAGASDFNHIKTGNVHIGNFAGFDDTSDFKLIIDHHLTEPVNPSPLVYGDFQNKLFTINGKFGVNTVNPTVAFEVYGNGLIKTDGLTVLGLQTNAPSKRAYIDFNYDAGNGPVNWGQIGKFFGSRALKVKSENELSFDVRGESALFIDSTGKIGVGMENPQVDFVINGDMHVGEILSVKDFTQRVGIGTLAPMTRVHVSSVENARLRLEVRDTTTNNIAGVEFGHFNGTLYRDAGRVGRKADGTERLMLIAVNDLELGAGDTPAMHIAENGKVGIGVEQPTANLQVVHGNNASQGGLRVENSNNGNWWRFFTRSGSNVLALYNNSGGLVGEFDDAGNYGSPSDIRRKKHVSQIPYGLKEINLLNPKRYQFNHQLDEDQKFHLGLMAQDVAAIIPELVNYSPDNDTYTLNYAQLGVINVHAIQELTRKNEQLKNELKEQQQELIELRKDLNALKEMILLKDQEQE